MKGFIKIKFYSYDKNNLSSAISSLKVMCKNLELKHSNPVSLPTKKHIITLLRSVFTHKDSKEHMGIRIYNKFFYIYFNNQKEVAKISNILNLTLPINVEIKITTKYYDETK